jgi:hypothetical protein
LGRFEPSIEAGERQEASGERENAASYFSRSPLAVFRSPASGIASIDELRGTH